MEHREKVNKLINDLMPIWQAVTMVDSEYEELIPSLHPNYRYSVKNFLCYLKLRTFDLRDIQKNLTMLGISSLNNSERQVLANIENILYLLHFTIGRKFTGKYPFGQHPVNFYQSKKVLLTNTKRLFKVSQDKGYTLCMVTLPSEAVRYEVVLELMQSGMQIARINTSHDNQDAWSQMLQNVHQAKEETGKDCAIYFDLSGPKIRTGSVGPSNENIKNRFISLEIGDLLYLHRNAIEGRNQFYDKKTGKMNHAKISISIPDIFDALKPGERIWFDDGAIAGVIKDKKSDKALVEILRVDPKGGRLKSQKGVNLPDTTFDLPSLTEDDLAHLPFIVNNTDMLGYSFVRTTEDVITLQNELKKLDCEDIGIILKIENKDAFDNLPALLLQAMQNPNIGVMTARGDLSVEIGPSRLSEVQEEIMWLCEAAFIPNIWATQVLEGLAKKGVASRAEISDAAMAGRTECVMLNKGKYITQAVKTLKSITTRMSRHQHKKHGGMRKLQVAERALNELAK